ncbi:PREDICTED: centrosome-associated zinc finger protein CP190 [Ceratosolen solmsi marchali]|uniref:Centrosome-associated zinc finger protein CP190 n=1 Tax=Ceratosolen solmsi marchali TaxID=326594 RepID=A0AAJ6YQN5_9HYME|nr:PREDICTED: centrosome-associated zinc finger protein CP190 [Ceratosolen solmsi marchali]
MQSMLKHEKLLPTQGLKQVKVDNWGTFFLQRLLQLYFNEELLDLNIKFHSSNNVLKVHRLVVTTCTDYFIQLEREQNKNNSNNDVIIMPSDMPFECVKSIVSFMYTGQLEYWSSEQNALYRTAQKMNMSVLIKLLDTQITNNILENNSEQKDFNKSTTSVSELIPNRKLNTISPTQSLPGKKLPVWKRKLDTETTMIVTKHTLPSYNSESGRYSFENNCGPSRFDVPEMEDLTLGVFSSFDDITYNTKPIAQAPEKTNDENKTNIRFSNNNISTMFLSFNGDDNCIKLQNRRNDSSDDDWTQAEFDSSSENTKNFPIKKVRFNLDEKENVKKSENDFISSNTTSVDSVDNHAKIIREVLKKYPHLVQHNKNIRLKIMQKESKNSECSVPSKTKVSYLVLKSDSLMINTTDRLNSSKSINAFNSDNNETGPWKCIKCNLDEKYTNYFMYRRHMQDVHGEKFDSRICEYCGYKATKRNILLYHMYTKHNVSRIKNTSFPKCQECSYIALSESLLIKHQISHKHRPTTLSLQKFTTESIKCVQCEKDFTDVTELALHEITSGHGTSLKNKKKKHYCTYCGKQFLKINNLKIHIDCQHKNIQKIEDCSNIPTLSEPSSEAESLSNVASGIATSLGVGDVLQSTDANEKQFEKSQINSTYIKNFEFEDQHMVMLINDENYQGQSFKNEYPLNISTNDEIVVRNPDGELVVYIQNTSNIESSRKLKTNATHENYKYLKNNDEIVEVVEELEDIEDVKQELEYKKIKTTHVFNKEEKQLCCVEHILTSESIKTNSIATEEVIQYVEEETEILEYETSTNI